MAKHRISREDVELFRTSVGAVIPLDTRRHPSPQRRPPARPVQRYRDEQAVVQSLLSDDYDPADIQTGDELCFARPGLQHGALRKLRRGQFSLHGELDLHGMTVAVAREALAQFLHDRRNANARCVRIIHGKGLGSRHRGPVLKQKLNSWLAQRDEVLAFCSARPADGGSGAVYVLLKKIG